MTFFTRLSAKATLFMAAGGMALGLAQAAQAEDRVTAVHAFPEFLVYTKTFLAMVADRDPPPSRSLAPAPRRSACSNSPQPRVTV